MTERELWTAKQVAAEYGWHPGYARRWLSDHGIEHIRTTGPRDTRLYDPEQVRAAHDQMPGRGYRTDLRTTPADPAGHPPTKGAPVDMRNQELHEAVTELIRSTFGADVAGAILDDKAFGALCGRLRNETGGDYEAMDLVLTGIANGLEDDTLDWLAETADKPAAYIASRI